MPNEILKRKLIEAFIYIVAFVGIVVAALTIN